MLTVACDQNLPLLLVGFLGCNLPEATIGRHLETIEHLLLNRSRRQVGISLMSSPEAA